MNERYIREHPLLLFFALASFVVGVAMAVEGPGDHLAPAIADLAPWITYVMVAGYIGGGFLTILGMSLFRGAKLEALGMVLLATVSFAAGSAALGVAGFDAAFIEIIYRFGLGAGCAVRAYYLATRST